MRSLKNILSFTFSSTGSRGGDPMETFARSSSNTKYKFLHCAKTTFRMTAGFALLVLGVCYSSISHAQVTNEEVIVVKEYEATIQDAQKVNIQPNIPEVEETKPVLTYSVPARDFKDIPFEANPLKPLSVSKEKLERYNSSFIKLGFGSQIMPLAQMAYNDNKTKNLRFGIFYNHLSAQQFKVKNQQFLDDEAGVYLKYFPKAMELVTNFTFRNYRTHFYGTDSSFEVKKVRQVFRTFDGQVYLKNAQRNKYDIDFTESIRFNYLQETYGKANEWFIAGNTDIKKSFLKLHSAGFIFNFNISRLKNDSLVLSRTIFTPMLGYGYNNDDWKARGYVGISMDGKKAVFACDLQVEKRLFEHSIIAYIGYTHGLQKNSLLSYSQTNNFIRNAVVIQNSTVGDLGLGFKGTLQNFSYNLAFHLNHLTNMPLFVNDTMEMKRFVVLYDAKALIYNFHFEGGYNVKEWLRLSLVGDYNYYQMKTEVRAWHQPAFKTTLRVNYIWKNKISVNLDVYGITGAYAKLSGGSEKLLKGTADINLGAEYLMNKHISFFLTLNNIANFKYQHWNNYQSYGISGMVGAKFSF